jgi:hypothetical protein
MHIMKKPTTFRILVTTTLMAALALVPWHVYGQQAPAATPTEGAQATAPLVEHLKVENGNILSRRASGWSTHGAATVGNAVKALRELYPNVTFAVDPRVAEVDLSDLIVRANNPITDLTALRTACGGRFSVHAEPNGLYTLECNAATEVNPPSKTDRQIECFSLTGYLRSEMVLDKDGVKKSSGLATTAEADALAAKRDEAIMHLREMITESIHDFDPSISQPNFRFYGDAEMLIVIGSERAIEVAGKVIQALPRQRTYQFVPADAPSAGDKSNNANRP